MRMKQIDFAGKAISVNESSIAPLYYPVDWEDELNQYGMIQAAEALLCGMPKEAVSTPWIIGSASKSLDGVDRKDSPSHLDHKAFDLSPMYSEAVALDPDKTIMGMAWNLFSLTIIAQCHCRDFAFVVEGDHLHVSVVGNPDQVAPGVVVSCLSTPTWYPIAKVFSDNKVTSAMIGTIWKFDLSSGSLIFVPRSEANGLLERYLC